MSSPGISAVNFDQQLVERCQQGDSAAFLELHDRHGRDLLAFLASRSPRGGSADDLAQTVWLRIWTNLDSFDGSHFRGWLYTIARNCLHDQWRKDRGSQQLSEDFDVPWTDRIEEDERSVALRECLEQLDSNFVATLRRNKLHGVGVETLAAEEGVAVATIYTRVDRGKRQLADCIEHKIKCSS